MLEIHLVKLTFEKNVFNNLSCNNMDLIGRKGILYNHKAQKTVDIIRFKNI